jgi:hypothetical protein
LIARLAAIVQDSNASRREAIAAAKAILAASRINLEGIGAIIKAHQHTELAERVAALEQQCHEADRQSTES